MIEIPEVLRTVKTRPLFVLRLDVKPMIKIGETPSANRRVGVVPGGSFEGERLSGIVLDGGSDWQDVRKDGSTTLDVRLILKTNDHVVIGMSYRGVRYGPAEIIQKIDAGEVVDPASYYFRTNPLFETGSEKYSWLNRIVTIGIGHRMSTGPVYSIFEIL
jgi:hypothetical protein